MLSFLNKNIFVTLEFDKIIDHLTQLPVSSLGKNLIHQISSLTDHSLVKQQLSETTELREILDFDDPFPLSGMQDIGAVLKKIQVHGSFLTPEELVPVVQTLEVARKIKSYFYERAEKYPLLSKIARLVQSFKSIEDEINRCVDRSNFNIFDRASSNLNKIRRSIETQEAQIRKKLASMLSAFSSKGYLQENLIVVRNSRLVLMVKDEHRGKVKGLVHDQSATGATLFVEPIETLELNNKIRALKTEERKEIERVLLKLTDLLREQLIEIDQTVGSLARFDFIYAKAKFSREINGCQPALNNNNKLEIIKGKHPLLVLRNDSDRSVIPLDLTMGENFKTLVISGPNAGGKTVALKTIGLLCLMTTCGLHIPADPSSDIAVFKNIFATIGDQQSIENDLSTFSSHVATLREIVDNAKKNDLVLIDEIGAGTDPDEGAALAIALLEELTSIGCDTVVSTHQGALKVFAHETVGVENGSMEFNRETLQPSYYFRLGIPGSSYAYEIANRLGVSERITNRAKELLGSKKNQLETLLSDLEKRMQKYSSLTNELSIKQSSLNSLIKLYENKTNEFRENERSIKKDAIEKAEQILKDANTTIERNIRQIKEEQASRESIKKAHELIRQQQKNLSKERERLDRKKKEAVTKTQQLDKVVIGQEVLWQRYQSNGIVMSVPDASGRVLIQTGEVKIKVPMNELFTIKTVDKKKSISSHVSVNVNLKQLKTNEIDIHGFRVEEGIEAVDKFLDEAIMSGFEQVYIIHGKGTGSLRKGVYKFLDNHPRVKSKSYPDWNLGDTGMTVVKLS